MERGGEEKVGGQERRRQSDKTKEREKENLNAEKVKKDRVES